MIHKEKKQDTLNIFLSYTTEDSSYAHKLERLLSQRSNVRIFTTEMLSAGEDWQSKLKDELSNCDIFVVMLSPNSVNSKWVLQELGAAWALNKPIVVSGTNIELLSKIPVDLDQSNFIDIKELDKPEILDQILESYEKVDS